MRVAVDRRLFWVGTLIAWGLATAYLVGRYAGHSVDDLFITFRYAHNLSTGQGLVFNPGERVFGLTNPGFAILLALLHLATGVSIPWLATAVSGLSLLGVALLLLREAEGAGRPLAGWIGGALALGSAYLWTVHGGEAPTVLLLLSLAAATVERRPGLAGLLAGIAVWMRPDAAVGAATLGALRWSEMRRLPRRYGIALAAVAGAGIAAAWLYFGSPVPVTLESKRILGALAGSETVGLRFWAKAAELWTRFGGTLALPLAAIGVLGLAVLARGPGRVGRLLAVNGLALAVAYPLLRVPFFLWYTVPTAFVVLYAAPFAVAALDGQVVRRLPPAESVGGRALRAAVAMAIAVPLLVPFVRTSLTIHRQTGWEGRLPEYRQAALWIRDHSAPGDAITCDEIGVLGFFSERPILDVMGLVSPEVLPYIVHRDFEGAFLDRPTRFVVYLKGRSWHGAVVAKPWFRHAYRIVARFPLPDGSTSVLVYRRRRAARYHLPGRPPARVCDILQGRVHLPTLCRRTRHDRSATDGRRRALRTSAERSRNSSHPVAHAEPHRERSRAEPELLSRRAGLCRRGAVGGGGRAPRRDAGRRLVPPRPESGRLRQGS